MRTLCDKCNREIDTECNLKGEYAYPYSFEYDTEPHVGSVWVKSQRGFLCEGCNKQLQEFMRPIPIRQVGKDCLRPWDL